MDFMENFAIAGILIKVGELRRTTMPPSMFFVEISSIFLLPLWVSLR